MLLKKITHGFAIQVFDTEKGRWISQEFVAGDQVEYETEDGETLDDLDFTQQAGGGEEPYLPFDMVQPEAKVITPQAIIEQREQIQEDLRCILDGLDDEFVDRACQVVVDRMNLLAPKTGPASVAEKLREVVSDSGVFVTEHIEELIDLLAKTVQESE